METYVWVSFLAIGVLALIQLATIAQSVQGTSAMMRRLLAHEGIEWETEVEPSPRVKALAADPLNRIAAIKAYREQTGLDVRRAKAVIDALTAARHGAG